MMIRHQVFLRFAADVSEETKNGLYRDLAGLCDKIEGILDFQTRRNISTEDPLVREFRDMFWFDFRDIQTRDAYLVDAAHKAVGARLVAVLNDGPAGVFVCDIEL